MNYTKYGIETYVPRSLFAWSFARREKVWKQQQQKCVLRFTSINELIACVWVNQWIIFNRLVASCWLRFCFNACTICTKEQRIKNRYIKTASKRANQEKSEWKVTGCLRAITLTYNISFYWLHLSRGIHQYGRAFRSEFFVTMFCLASEPMAWNYFVVSFRLRMNFAHPK